VKEKVPKRIKPPKGEVYMRTECPRGELGYYIVSDGTPKPYRIKVKSPCFTVMSAFREISKGAMIADIIAILGSIDIVLGEIDR
jgi:NADH-quinone oxidoreductase subunit D